MFFQALVFSKIHSVINGLSLLFIFMMLYLILFPNQLIPAKEQDIYEPANPLKYFVFDKMWKIYQGFFWIIKILVILHHFFLRQTMKNFGFQETGSRIQAKDFRIHVSAISKESAIAVKPGLTKKSANYFHCVSASQRLNKSQTTSKL
jgi:hypothetical protein